jgi:DNA polymerase I
MTPHSGKKLFLLDAMALVYRAYYALNKNPRINSRGLNTSAALGFVNTLYDVLKNEKPTHIAVAFDSFAPTLRHDEFSYYKANREEMPEDIAVNLPYIRRLIGAFRIPLIEMEGYEADDIIGTLALKASEENFTTYMMTPDKDFGQLVGENVFIYKPARSGEKPEILGIQEVCAKYSLSHPEQLIDLLGLWGDASDNIPGIPGVGEVTAKKLLAEFGSIENLIEHAAEIKNEKLRAKVIEFSDQAMQSKMLATIITDVPVDIDFESMKMEDPDTAALKEVLDELEFRTFAKRVFTDLSLKKAGSNVTSQPDLFGNEETPAVDNFRTIEDVPHSYQSCDTAAQREALIQKLSESENFCFDTETTGLDPNHAELVGISFCIHAGEAYYVPVPEHYPDALKIVGEFRALFENENIGKTGQNMKFDIAMLRWYDVNVKGVLFDTMIAHYLLQPDQRHNMDFLARTYLNYSPVPIETLIGKKGKNQTSMRFAEAASVAAYACEDADITLQLREVFDPMLREAGAERLFRDIEMQLVQVLAAMEAEGVKLDPTELRGFSATLEQEIKQLETEIYELTGSHFNIASPKQLGEVIYDKMRIVDKPRKTATKQNSTAEDVLIRLVNHHPVVQKILDYRSLTKLKSTYIDVLPTLISTRTGRIHSSFNQAVAATGRLSSNNPNLQNIPIRTERGREIRRAFVPRNEDFVMLSADYSQVELRIIASLSGDKHMTEDFRNGLDIHTATAARVYNVPLENVTKDMRRNAKTVNFGIIYGISAFGLSERLNIPRKEAADIIRQYFEKYPSIRKYMDDTIAFARENGYVETILGRRRYLRDINSSNAVVRGFAERNAINAPIQGSAADIIKKAMIALHAHIEQHALRSRMIMQVHDELVFDVYKAEEESFTKVVRQLMSGAVTLDVPLDVEISSGANWLEAH